MRYITTIIVLFFIFQLSAQTIQTPNFASATHPITINRIEQTPLQTIVYLTIENQIPNGAFCADKNITLTDQTRNSLQLIRSENIPNCPDSYQFKAKGESLEFILYFQGLAPNAKYLDLIENCTDNCFSIKGIILDDKINKEVNTAYSLYAEGKLKESVEFFEAIIKATPDYNYGIYYFNLIMIYSEMGDINSAQKWHNLLSQSDFQDKDLHLSTIRKKGYFRN